jgi:transposase
VPQSTAIRWLKQVDKYRTGKFREGRPCLINEKTLDKIEKWFTGYYKYRIQGLDDIIQHFNLDISPAILQRVLDRRGFHKYIPEMKEWIPPKARKERLSFARKYKNKKKPFWRKGI